MSGSTVWISSPTPLGRVPTCLSLMTPLVASWPNSKPFCLCHSPNELTQELRLAVLVSVSSILVNDLRIRDYRKTHFAGRWSNELAQSDYKPRQRST